MPSLPQHSKTIYCEICVKLSNTETYLLVDELSKTFLNIDIFFEREREREREKFKHFQ